MIIAYFLTQKSDRKHFQKIIHVSILQVQRYKKVITQYSKNILGQLIAYELVHASDSGCPAELIKVPIPDNDLEIRNTTNAQTLAFIRSTYDHKTGFSPNSPRRPVSKK